MADPLSLLFELNVDGRPAADGLLRFRRDIEATIAAARRAVAQPVNTGPAATAAVRASLTAQQRAVDTLTRSSDRLTESIARGSRLLPEFQQRLNSIGAAALRVGGGLRSMGASMAILVSGPLVALGRVSGQAAADIDAIRNRLIATEGSLAAANARLAQLRQLADSTVGVTRRTALDTFAILATLGEITEDTINKQIRAFGRLNAAFTIDDQQTFFRNLIQIFQQGFEIKDIREALGRVSIFNQLLEQAFGSADPDHLRQLKAAGKLTLDTFLAGMATAVENNPVLGRIQESISVRFAKTFERLRDALEPLGLAILGPLERIVTAIEPIILRIAAAFARLPPGVQTAIVAIGILTAALGPVLFVLGGVASGVGAIATAIAALTPILAGIGLPAIAAVIAGIVVVIGEWVAILGALGLAWRTNFLNIRGLVTDAAGAVLEAFSRIKAIIDELVQRILPTLQSITTRTLGFVTAVWERYGADVVRVVSAAFTFVTRVVETFLRVFGNVVDLLLKLIDGDFRGAWAAFARIVVAALGAFDEAINKLPGILAGAFTRLHAIIVAETTRFIVAGTQLAVKFVAGITTKLIASAPVIKDALVEMLVLAVGGLDPTSIAATLVGRFLAALKRAAAEGITVPVTTTDQNVGVDVGVGAGILRKKTSGQSTGTGAGGAATGADAETRRRIRLLELEAERAEAIARQRIAAENILFEQRKTSLRDFTNFQIKEEEIVLEKKREVFAAERAEAEKLGKGRDLALGQIRLKELQAELEFADRRNQLLANQEQEEFESAKAHRQALLDIQDEGDRKQLEKIDSYVERLLLSYEEAEKRRLEIEDDARRRRRDELDIQLGEAGQNVEEQQRIKDAIAKLDAESATAKEEAENRKRRALRATLEAELQYYDTLHEITQRATQLLRDAADIQLGRLISRFGDRRKFRLEALRLEREANEQEHNERLRQIEQEKQDAEKRLEGVRDAEEKLIALRRHYAELERAEKERRAAEQQQEEDDERDTRDPFRSLRERFENFRFDIENTNEAIKDSLESLSNQVSSSISAMGDAFQQAIIANILYGESIGKALKAALAQQLAAISAEAAIQSLKHAAYALGSLAFGNFASAGKHAAAAAAFGALAVTAGLAGRALAKSSGLFDRGRSSSTASAGVDGGEPRNRQFQGGQGVESSSQAAREGSGGGLFGPVMARIEALQQQSLEVQRQQQLQNAQVAETLTRMRAARPGDVVTMGAGDAREAIAVAVIDHSNASGDFNEHLQRNLGFA